MLICSSPFSPPLLCSVKELLRKLFSRFSIHSTSGKQEGAITYYCTARCFSAVFIPFRTSFSKEFEAFGSFVLWEFVWNAFIRGARMPAHTWYLPYLYRYMQNADGYTISKLKTSLNLIRRTVGFVCCVRYASKALSKKLTLVLTVVRRMCHVSSVIICGSMIFIFRTLRTRANYECVQFIEMITRILRVIFRYLYVVCSAWRVCMNTSKRYMVRITCTPDLFKNSERFLIKIE